MLALLAGFVFVASLGTVFMLWEVLPAFAHWLLLAVAGWAAIYLAAWWNERDGVRQRAQGFTQRDRVMGCAAPPPERSTKLRRSH